MAKRNTVLFLMLLIPFIFAFFYDHDSDNRESALDSENELLDASQSSHFKSETDLLKEGDQGPKQKQAERDRQSVVLIHQAAACYAFIDEVRSGLPQNTNIYRIMGRLQELLFIEDLKYARMLNKRLRTADVEDLLTRFRNGELITDISISLGLQANHDHNQNENHLRVSDSDVRREFVQQLKQSVSPASQQMAPLFEILNELNINPEKEIELFKDITMYLVMKTDVQTHYDGLFDDLGESESLLKSYAENMDAIRSVFDYRITNHHQRDSNMIAEQINHLSLSLFNFDGLRRYGE